MKSLITITLATALLLPGCLARVNVYKRVTAPDGTVTEYNDRVLAAMDASNMEPAQRVQVILALLERESAGGERWKEFLNTLDQAALMALFGTFIK